MSRSRTIQAAVSGVLLANSSPHLAAAAGQRRFLTPLAGRDSAPAVNAVWGLANLAGGLLLFRRAARDVATPWSSVVRWFDIGTAAWAVWMVVSEQVLHVNTPRDGS